MNNSDKISEPNQNQDVLNKSIKMGIQILSNNILLATLPEQPHMGVELNAINKIVSEGCNRNVIIDFYQVKMLTSESICGLMTLERLLSGLGYKLVLCNVSAEIKQIFTRTGLEPCFEFADDDYTALQSIRSSFYLYG